MASNTKTLKTVPNVMAPEKIESDDEDVVEYETETDFIRKFIVDTSYGWVIVIASYLCHLVIGGLMRAGGVIFIELQEQFKQPAADTAWVVSLAVTVRMLFGPLASALCNRFSCRTVVMTGGLLCSLGAFISGFADSIGFLYFSYSGLGGIGRAFIYTPAVVIVGLYFEKRRGTAVGIANAGIGSGTFLVPPLVELVFSNFSFTSAFILLAAFSIQACVYGALFRPLNIQYKIVVNNRKKTEKLEEDNQMIHSKDQYALNNDRRSNDLTVGPESAQIIRNKLIQSEEKFPFKHSRLSLHSTNSSIQRRHTSFKGSNYSLHVVQGLDTGALYITKSNDHLHPSLKDTIVFLGSNRRLHKNKEQLSNANIHSPQNSISSLFKFVGYQHPSVHQTCPTPQSSHNSLAMQLEITEKSDLTSTDSKWLDLSLLKDARFLSFCIGIGLYTLSFQASYVFIPPLAIQKHLSHLEAAYIVSIAGGLETTGSILSGIFLDLPTIKPHRLNIYNLTMFVLGALTFIMPLMSSFELLSVVCGMYGFLLGSCLAQKATLVVDILGVGKLVSSFGILVCFQGFGVLIGPPLSGFLKDKTGQYDEGFYLGGATMVASGIVQCIGSLWHHIHHG